MKTYSYAVVAAALLKTAFGQNSTSPSPCSVVSSAVAAAGTDGLPTVSAQLAQDCLDTVPVVTDDATRLIDGIAPFLQFQSTLAYLKNPPKTYQLPAVDILGALDKIRQNVTNGVYKSEHSLQTDIFDLLLSAHDGHLNWQGDLIGAAFVFRYPWKLVSVSEDGKKTPLVYTAYDILANSTDLQVISSTFQAASPVVEINGRPVVSFLKDLSLRQSWMLDPDGLYNSLFWSKAQNGTGAFMKPDLAQSPGDISTLKFANGSIHTYSNIAVTGNFTGIVDGESLYAQYCTGRPFQLPSTIPEELQKRQVSNSSQSPQAPPGYPDPVQIQSKFKVGGYYLQGHGLDTTAVLSVPSFDPGDTQGLDLEFQRTIQNFLAQAKADGKTKLIVDLQANTGGTVALGFDTFLQLFPNLEAVILNNWRAHTGFDVIGRGMNERLVNAASASTADFESIRQAGGTASFATINAKNENGSSITSWDQLYNPTTVNNDNFTALHQWALNSTFWTNPLQITTFGDRTNWTTPPFKAEDVIMITDGFCGSTCSVFAELMRTQAKIKSYTFGGRPDNTGPMQAVGGVRGGNVLTWVELATFVGLATNFTTKDPFPDDATKIPPDVETQINDLIHAKYSTTSLANLTVYGLQRSPRARVNFINTIRVNDASRTPTQFLYDAADCRLWYTPAMINDVTEIWRVTANTAWGNGSMCLPGSTGDPTSVSGGAKSNGTAPTVPKPSASQPLGKNAASTRAVGGLALIVTVMAAIFSFL